jgi:DNA-binding NarL/FixJ family response regulator
LSVSTRNFNLNSRQLEILRLLAGGRTNREIAEAVGLSSNTVKSHVAAICFKLGVRNRVQAAVAASKAGLV